MPGHKKRYSVVDNLVLSPDRAEFCCKIKVVKDADNTIDGLLAIVIHGDKNAPITPTETQESCLIFFEETKDISMPPIVLKTLPICSDLNVEIAQSTLPNKNNSDLLVTFLMKQDSARVIFTEKETMVQLLSEIKVLKAVAENNKLYSTSDRSYEWIKTYSQFKIEKNEKRPIRANSLPIDDENPTSALRYVLPLQRAETIAKINLKRTRTVNVARERKIKLEDAKKHWINNQLMNREDEFVKWQKTRYLERSW
ncbi:hypothetical protein BDF21DRAFT_183158 [Thamnidium elegans]|nr:hypothetical protein BDF21DRAFT_183158 [Thamnidium elegans]